LATGRLGLIFLVRGFDETLRINGRAMLSTNPVDLQHCADDRRSPKLVIKVTVDSLYLHCGKALMRSHLWDASRQAKRSQMPSLGEIVRDQVQAFKGQTLDAPTQDEMLKRYRETL
jgi:predicted pyridoxine 5'-phosphate oxidase superfamily flavin-nucleotide-binding protein